jgi:hypothetical protein
MATKTLRLSLLLLGAPLLAQVGAVPGTDIRLYEVLSPTVYGRRGLAYPNGEIAMAIGHAMCNGGTVHLPWVGWVSGSGSVMLDTYPKIAFLIARESNGRMVQVSGKSFMKHSRVAFNLGSSVCGTCQSGPSQTFRVGCYDAYSTGFNGNQYNLGPTDEVNPWEGSWDPQGSYFDRGDPPVSGPAATDSIQSLTVTGWDQFKNRILVREQELAIPGAAFYGQAQVVAKGEPGNVRGDNLTSRGLNITWNGSSWSASLGTAGNVYGTVLNRWSGASVATNRNGMDDGHFHVGVRVTGPVNGLWHYEYAVHNQDNHRGGASLRIPICPTARVFNAGFRDIDDDALNQWTVSHSGGEVAFLATGTNALDWNCIYNFWFDSDAAPVAGTVAIDQARVGPGALTVSVSSQVPGSLLNEHLGAGCGTPTPALWATGSPTSPNPGYGLRTNAPAGAFVLFAFASSTANVPLGGGCSLYVDAATLLATPIVTADGAGLAAFALPIPPGLSPLDLACQAFELVASGPVYGLFNARDGLRIRAAGTGCP